MTCLTDPTLAAHRAPRRPGRLADLLRRWRAARALARQRRDLAALDAHLLRDIGLTEAEARAEAARPAWDAPAHWRD